MVCRICSMKHITELWSKSTSLIRVALQDNYISRPETSRDIQHFWCFKVLNPLRRRFVASAWLGILMPAMLSCYELGNLVVLQRTFLAEFVTQRQVRRQYLESNQAILVSAQICMVHAMAEGARMTLILSDMSHAKEQNFEFLVPILSGVAWNVMAPWLRQGFQCGLRCFCCF